MPQGYDQEVLQAYEVAEALWPDDESPNSYDYGQYIGKRRSPRTIRDYGHVKNMLADYLQGKGMESVDRFLDPEQPVPSLHLLKRVIRSTAKRSTGVQSTLMSAHSLATFVTRLLGAIGWYMKKSVPSEYYKALTDFVYQDITKELNLSLDKLDKNTATSNEFDRFLKKTLEVRLVRMFPTLRDAISYLLYLNMYVDVGARGSDLVQLLYKDCTFYLAPKQHPCSVLAVVSLTHMKSRYVDVAKKIPLHFMEVNCSYRDSCRLLFLAALGDHVFRDFQSWDELQSVGRMNEPLLLTLRDEKQNTPIFSHIKANNAINPENKLVSRSAEYYGLYTSSLAKAMGLSRRVTLYSFRRMGLQAMAKNQNVTTAQRMQFAGHKQRHTYDRSYAPQTSEADIQARIRGLPARSKTIQMFNGVEAQRLKRASEATYESLANYEIDSEQAVEEVDKFIETSDVDYFVADATDIDSDSDTTDDELFKNNDKEEASVTLENDFNTIRTYLTELPMERESFMMTRCAGYMERS